MTEAEGEEEEEGRTQEDQTGSLVEKKTGQIILKGEAAAEIVVGGWVEVEAGGVGEGGKAAGVGGEGGGQGEAMIQGDDAGRVIACMGAVNCR